MNTPHRYAEILNAIAAGEEIEVKITEHGTWKPINGDLALNIITLPGHTSELRVKSKTIIINRIEGT